MIGELRDLALRAALAVAILAAVVGAFALVHDVLLRHQDSAIMGVAGIYLLAEVAALLHRCNRSLRGMS